MKYIPLFLLFVFGCDGVLSDDATPKIVTDCGAITTCGSDGCCPAQCADGDDPDCSLTCGDGVIDDLETCDGDCPTTCDDGDVCTSDSLSGAASTCSAACVSTQITECSGGDGCCPAGCEDLDSDCSSACDGVGLCQSGDGCCPDGCEPSTDDDCQVDCSNPASWPGDWGTFEAQVVDELNRVRAQGATCGQFGNFAATGPLAMDTALQQAARCHSDDMASNSFFDHAGSDGSSFGQRTQRAGFAGQPIGENIGVGYGTPADVVAGWVASDGHCQNLMNPSAELTGIGYLTRAGTEWTRYWTMVTGR